MKPLADRFAAKVAKSGPDECWPWQGYRVPKGYGMIQSGGRSGKPLNAHRVAYELGYGSIPEGMMVCHHCDNPPCCNPRHLFLGKPKDNTRDMVRKGRQGKLTWEAVREIRLRASQGESVIALAGEFDVTRTNVDYIVKRKTWKE